jgi:hypothetical protein
MELDQNRFNGLRGETVETVRQMNGRWFTALKCGANERLETSG